MKEVLQVAYLRRLQDFYLFESVKDGIIKLIPGNGKHFSKICSYSMLTGECVFGIIANIRSEQMFLDSGTGSDGK